MLTCLSFLSGFTPAVAVDLQVLGGTYDQPLYTGYKIKGTYLVELSKDDYSFTANQFEINVSLPQQGAYDPARAAEAIIPTGWELVINSNTSLILRLLPGSVYAGTGAAANRSKNFSIPIITLTGIVDNPSLVTVQWNDFEVEEATTENSSGTVLNILPVNLPVILISFTADREGAISQLHWATAMETNSNRFEIQRSGNAQSWTSIGSLPSHGESTTLKNYAFTDAVPNVGTNYYRLKMVDRAAGTAEQESKDAKFAYSSIKSVNFDVVRSSVSFYPNPATNILFLKDIEPNGIKEVAITAISGQIMYRSASAESPVSSQTINITNLASGMYVVKVTKTDGTLSVHKIIIAR